MDVTTIRHQNFVRLLDDLRRKHKLKVAAAELNMGASYASQLYNGKPMGNDVARKVEVAAKLPHGYMDQLHQETGRIGEAVTPYLPTSPSSPSHAQILAAGIKLARLASENLELPFDPELEEDANISLLAIEYLVSRKERTVTADNVVDFTKRLRQANRGNGDDGSGSVGGAGRRAG